MNSSTVLVALLFSLPFVINDVLADDVSIEVRAAAQVNVTESDDAILVRVGQNPVLQYNKTNTKVPEGIDPIYARSGYIHPIYSPAGKEVTGQYPADHPHQSGLFSAWVNANFRGHAVDFWNKKKALGRVSHDKVLFLRNLDDRAEFSVQMIHEDTSVPDSPVIVLRETWTVVVYGQSEPGYLIDITSVQSSATADPLTVNEYHYGGMAIRGNGQWYSDESGAAAKAFAKELRSNPDAKPPGIDVMKHVFLTSENKQRVDGNHSRPNWVDLYGLIDGQAAGIAVLNQKNNFRFPQPVRLHPAKPYFCLAPCVLGSFEIGPGKELISNYRLVVHDGNPQPKQWDKLWKNYN